MKDFIEVDSVQLGTITIAVAKVIYIEKYGPSSCIVHLQGPVTGTGSGISFELRIAYTDFKQMLE